MELESDLSKIQSEELLRKMWQQSEDINRKKEIRSQLYKLRESRLRDLYQFDIMSDNRVAGFGKDPLAPSHGESLADQSFQSLKTKEIRDSMSPTEMKFQSMALNNPSTTGWNVQSSSEVSPDGRGYRAETVATTDGVENINGGTAEFKGRNEQRSSAMHEGDDKNFVKQASESSNTHLQEKVVVGDENSGRTEMRMSSSTSTSSSKVIQSSSTTDYDGQPIDYHPKYLMDTNRVPQRMQEPQYHQRPAQYEPQPQQEVRRGADYYNTVQQHDQQTEHYNQNRHETNTSQNVQTNELHEQNKRYVDVDKASPEYQRHVQYLMAQPGEIISNTVEYPKPNVKMITTVKRLPDGTIVRNKRYETEESAPTPTPTHTTNTRPNVSNNTTQRRDTQTNQQSKNYQGPPPSERMRHPNDDVVDNVEKTRYIHDAHRDSISNVETKHSTVKTSSRKFSTETTSETIQESDDSHYPTPGSFRPKPVTNDFSTHGFPSVRPNKPTQEFVTDRPQSARPNQAYPSQNLTSPKDVLIPTRGEYEPTITERRIPTDDGEVIIVSSEKKRNIKQHTNSERIIETDIRTTDDNRYQEISDVTKTNRSQDFSTHGFPSVKEPHTQPKTFPDIRQVQHHEPTPGYPVGARPAPLNNSPYAPVPDDDIVVGNSQKTHTTKHTSNTERIIQTEILGDDGRPLPRPPAGVEYITNKYTVTTPGDQVPRPEYPDASSQTPGRDYPTQGFPSVRSPTKGTPDYSTHGFPSARDSTKPSGTPERLQASPVKPQSPTPSTKKPNATIEATERIIRKEKEVDATHRAFAASLRSSSPVDNTRRESYSTDGPRHTPRSSVSSTKTFRRDMREGSHDSAPSETSRLSSTTVTRQTPPRTVGGRTVVTKQTVVTNKNNQGSNELINVTASPRGTKSPSPGKTVTTTTTTRTVTSKAPQKDVPKSDNQHTTTTTTTDTIFPINHDSLTITKKNISDNHSNSNMPLREVVEEPCVKKHYYLLGPSDHPNTAQKQGKRRMQTTIKKFKLNPNNTKPSTLPNNFKNTQTQLISGR